MSVPCPRQWQAEAVDDGRLGGAERASFLEHAATCRDCTRERHLVETIRARARALPSPTPTPLERRRLRRSLLERAYLPLNASRPTVAFAFATVMLVAASAAAGIHVLYKREPAPSAPVAIPPVVRSTAPTPALAPVEPPAVATPASPVSAAPAPPRHVALPTPGAQFAEAMSAFTAGDYQRADRLFARFEAAYPTDSRAEDAGFLRAVGRSRAGDDAGARDLARSYLGRYPSGLRRAEAEALLR